ncbi:eCIS core domain-containing protein [Sphingomonas sp. Root241]|uniref:eCIS core domain-containing protein n=1 Tax=Sphingomonas sp. Root241 TaxID=1736501 RepID=UPI0009EB88B4|nr:DUF4157 domain-containing protein [Sphingomonas sp. Root241]
MAELAHRLSNQPTRSTSPAGPSSGKLGARSAVAQLHEMAARLNARSAPAPIQAKAAPRDSLPANLKTGMEALSGIALDDVRVHRNSARPAQMQAHAYAQGTDIHLAPGQEQHLPHEAWHVVQQKQGRVRATRHDPRGQPINDSPSLESEADRMGAIAARPIAQAKAAPPLPSLPLSLSAVRQPKVVYAGNFHPDAVAPDVIEYDDIAKAEAFDDAKAGIELYKQGDQNVAAEDKAIKPALTVFETEPDLELVITTDAMEAMGDTAMAVMDGQGVYRGLQQNALNSATSDQWPPWMTAGNAVRITVTLREDLSKAAMAHTLNHEISVHATNKLPLIRKVRGMNHPQMARNFVDATMFGTGAYSADHEHALLGADKNPRLKATHRAMKAASKDAEFNEALDRDYASDVEDHKGYVPRPYVPPFRQLKASGASAIQMAKSSTDAQSEMARAMGDYQEDLDAEDDDYDDDDDEEEANPLFGQLTSTSCGIAAVQMVMASKSIYMDAGYIERLSQDYPKSYNPAAGAAMGNIAKVLNNYVPCSAPKVMSLTAVIEALAKGPVIARVDGAHGHFVVIDSVSGDAPVQASARALRVEGTRVLSIRDPWPPGKGETLSVTEQEFQNGGGQLRTTALYIHLT